MATTCKLAVTELREKLRARGLATYGTKAELMARLDLAEPHWRDEAILDTTDDDGATALETPAIEGGEVESLRRQVEVLMREVEQLRGIPEQRPRVNDRHREVSLSVISDMIDVFDGSVGTFTVWERRVRYIQRMHQLRDTEIVMIISLKLRRKALRWFHSKPEFVTYGVQELLAAMEKMFSSRQSIITLKKQFEERNTHYILVLDTLLDSGSPVSFIKKGLVVGPIDPTSEIGIEYYGINNSRLQVHGSTRVSLKLDDDERVDIRLLVVPDTTMVNSVILGRDALKKCGLGLSRKDRRSEEEVVISQIMNIEINDSTDDQTTELDINPEIAVEKQNELKEILKVNYLSAPRPEKPKISMELKLTLQEHQPFHFSPRRLSFVEKNQVREIIGDLLERGIIRPSESDYASPIVLVKKKNGKNRMCVDYRALNKVTISDRYPLPLIEDQLEVLTGEKIF
ncbi:hypothetical protein M0804_015511 [Polistes exclamans]|nr:hypothetical protein M0804_015511 [Polistes exclamans]